jgi:cytochrome c oxidase subunit 2
MGRGHPVEEARLVLSRRTPWWLLLVTSSFGFAGCGGDHHVLAPHGPESGRVSALGWGMIITATVITLVVFGLLVAALLPGDRRGLRRLAPRSYVIAGGLVLPVVVLLTLSGLTVAATDATGRHGDLQVEVIGHQYWWEVRYPGTRAVTANEIHIPARTRVRLILRSDDVIHSAWVPALAGKIDLVPGRTNHLVIDANRPGTYRGQCAEFCGLEHARMAFTVIAQPPSRFRAWLRQQAVPARTEPGVARGRSTFLGQACAGCHTIRGTSAVGTKGPDLTHVASRRTLAALTLPNDRAALTRWIRDPQDPKPGARMPAVDLTPSELRDVVAYLDSLR